MKKIFLLSLSTFIIFSCSQEKKVVDPFQAQQKQTQIEQTSNPVTLVKTSEYIEKSEKETLFLFKAPKGAKIEFSIGKKGSWFKDKTVVENYEGNGLTISDLTPGTTYEYKVKMTFEGKKIVSPLESFTKETLNFTKDRPTWAKDAVFYEVFVRSFSDSNGDGIGDFNGLKNKIPYLKELGVNALWLMPINDSPSYHGYDVIDYKSVEKDYGTIEDFKGFLAEAKKNNIKVIMDFVLNHSSSQNPWFKEAVNNPASPYRDYYIWDDGFENTTKPGDWGQKVWHPKNDSKYYGVFWDGMPDLNYRNKNLRKDIKDISKFWLDLGIDGFRLDASKYIDLNTEVTHLWWNDFNSYVKSVNKDAFIVGENWDTSVNYVAKFMKSMDSSFNFNLRDVILDAARGNDVDLMKTMQKRNELYSKENENFIDSMFVGNHDVNRLANEVLKDIDKQKLALTILMTLPGTPFIYYGEELGMIGSKPDEDIREAMDWYAKVEGQGVASNLVRRNTAADDGISYEEQSQKTDSLFQYTKKLISIRKNNPYIVNGTYKDLNLGFKMNGYEISKDKEKLTVVHNSSVNTIQINIDGKSFDVPKYSSIIVKNGENLLK